MTPSRRAHYPEVPLWSLRPTFVLRLVFATIPPEVRLRRGDKVQTTSTAPIEAYEAILLEQIEVRNAARTIVFEAVTKAVGPG